MRERGVKQGVGADDVVELSPEEGEGKQGEQKKKKSKLKRKESKLRESRGRDSKNPEPCANTSF